MPSREPVVHLVYPHGPGISTPDAIGRKLAERLGSRYDVQLHDWVEVGSIRPRRGDVLIGHPHPARGTVFRQSIREDGWGRKIVLSPFVNDLSQVGFLDPIVRRSDLYLAITGRFWFERPGPYLAHWRPRMVHVDLAVDRTDFPRIKGDFAPPRKRRFVYIGHGRKYKNIAYLARIARAMPEFEFAWIGTSRRTPGLRRLGQLDFGTDTGKRIVAGYDFLLTVGRADANPTTILESMAWGLIPVCTPESGYIGLPGIPNVPLDDVPAAVAVLERLQEEPNEVLEKLRAGNDVALEDHFNWDRLAGQVIEAIEGDALQDLKPVPLAAKIRRGIATVGGAHSPLRPDYMLLSAASIWPPIGRIAGARGSAKETPVPEQD